MKEIVEPWLDQELNDADVKCYEEIIFDYLKKI